MVTHVSRPLLDVGIFDAGASPLSRALSETEPALSEAEGVGTSTFDETGPHAFPKLPYP
jgi:hypothetical protein